jgi:hypothetical protein
LKAFCIYTAEIPESVQSAKRCIESANKLGIDVELYKSVWHENIYKEIDKLGVKLKYKPVRSSKTDFQKKTAPCTRVANGITHYKLYKHSAETNQPIAILEHDAYFVSKLPAAIPNGIIQISCTKQQWTPETLYNCNRANKMKKYEPSRKYNWSWNKEKGTIIHPISGLNSTAGYIIGPVAAQKMINYLEKDGIGFADRVRDEHIGYSNLYLQVPQCVICDHNVITYAIVK